MSLPTSESIPDDFNALSPAQKRRIRYAIHHASDTEVQVFLSELKRRATPGFDFFVFTLLGSLITAIAILLDSPLILVAAMIASPFLTPLMGISLAPALKSFPFFMKSVACILISAATFFAGGALAGFVSRLLPLRTLTQIPLIATSNWVTWVVLIIVSILTAIFFVRHEDNPRLIGTLLSYLILLPVAVAGFYLFIEGDPGWLQVLQLSLLRLVVAAFIISVVFLILGLHPRNSVGWLTFLVILAGAIILLTTHLINWQPSPSTVNTRPLPTQTFTATATSTQTPLPPTATHTKTSTHTLTPTCTPTNTLTPTSTPIWAEVEAENGAVIRAEPDFDAGVVAYAQNGSLVQMLSETYQAGNSIWVKVIASDGTIGWILRTLLVTATPSP